MKIYVDRKIDIEEKPETRKQDTLNGALLRCIINGYKRRVEKNTLTQVCVCSA